MTHQRAEVLIPCDDLGLSLEFYTGALGFNVDMIFPADSPRTAGLSGHGISLRLSTEATSPSPTIHLVVLDPGRYSPSGNALIGPEGTTIYVEALSSELHIPISTQDLVVSRADDVNWGVGRAGMSYRDLIPGRHGGRYIASHISIPSGGPVPDYVHYHKVRFQLIYCRRGSATLVYEDQGQPFTFSAGDCVLQPPEIRHQVLDASDGFEVVELGCPAEHVTLGDRTMPLPNGQPQRGRSYGGQLFVHHRATEAQWSRWRSPGYETRDTGIANATADLADVLVVRPTDDGARATTLSQTADFQFFFVLDGSCVVTVDGDSIPLGSGDSISIPMGSTFSVTDPTDELELLDVSLPE